MLKDRSWQEIGAAFERARTRQPALSEYLGFYEKLVREQHSVTVDLEPNAYDEDSLRSRMERGEPLIDRGDIRIDLTSAEALFRGLCRLAGQRGAEVRAAAEEIESMAASGSLDLQGLLLGTVAEEGYPFAVADQLGLDPELLNTLACAAIRPGVQALAKILGSRVDHGRWRKTICPVCGSAPGFGELRGDELAAPRYLHCGFCGWAWAVDRIGCPYCDNKDHNRLQTLIIEDYQQCKLEVCEACRRYLKVVDNKEFFGLIPEIEDLATPHLDLAALERGYH